jgi:hypothetical protein
LLLDYDDAFHIDSVGIYFARQGVLQEWTVSEFLSLTRGSLPTLEVSSLRERFKELAVADRKVRAMAARALKRRATATSSRTWSIGQ